MQLLRRTHAGSCRVLLIDTDSQAHASLVTTGELADANGNLLADGVTTYTWDRADRLLSAGGASYAYDGLGNRVRQTVGTVVSQYLLDLQPGLTQMLAQVAARQGREVTEAHLIREAIRQYLDAQAGLIGSRRHCQRALAGDLLA